MVYLQLLFTFIALAAISVILFAVLMFLLPILMWIIFICVLIGLTVSFVTMICQEILS
ncbi:Uncharacterised protein [Helicobacter muridarum]|uniref:Uncharacterized protein n=1 Tax=Helicobacter muridarum TaxID=216 RepID=A0A377PX06_9HELI|nr:Uncharacterised protein [Helicobacter muridarum]